MENPFITVSAEATRAFGETLAQTLRPGTLLALTGDLGAGKTTLVQGLLAGLGALPPYPSPTFVLMNQYELVHPSATGITRVYHADAYRVEAADFERLGFAEWCADEEAVVLLEWPERLASLLPKRYLQVSLVSLPDSTHSIEVREIEP